MKGRLSKLKDAVLRTIYGVPERIPIQHARGYNEIGWYDNGNKQFLGNVICLNRTLAVLHSFDADGNYLSSQVWSSEEKTIDGVPTAKIADAKFNEMLNSLGSFEYGSIAIKWFWTTLDGVDFGFTPGIIPFTVSLEPNDWVFYAPWEGRFDT